MKKSFAIIALAALVMLAGCKKNDQEGTVLKAGIEQHKTDGSKTSLNPDFSINWSEGDQLLVNNGTAPGIFTLTTGAGNPTAEFATTGEYTFGENNVVVYPYSDNITFGENTVTMSLPATQEVEAPGTFGNGANPMLGTFTDPTNFTVTSLCGALCLQLKGDNQTITSIEIVDAAGAKLNGTFVANYTAGTPALAKTGDDGTDKVTLSCPALLTDDAQKFFVVLPAGALASGFTMNVYNGTDLVFTKTTSTDVTMVVNTVKTMGEMTVTTTPPTPVAPNGALPNGFSVSPTQRVWFSQGNLRATAAAANNSDPSNWTWSFAEHQWDYIGNATANTSVNGNGTVSTPGTVDLFCWSTDWSYYGIRNDAYQTNTHLYIGDFIDWGNNTITNGTNPVNPWRTLTNDEWSYLLNGRDDHESKYSVGKIDDIVGFVILPDTWVLPENCTFQPGKRPNGQWHWEDNPYQTTDPTSDNYWPKMEAAGAAFLPATGDRYGASVTIWSYDNRVNGYWSSTPDSDDRLALYFGFNVSDYLGLYSLAFAQSYRYVGMCVRLVQNIE